MKVKKTILILILILLISTILYFFVKFNRSLYNVSSDLVEGFGSKGKRVPRRVLSRGARRAKKSRKSRGKKGKGYWEERRERELAMARRHYGDDFGLAESQRRAKTMERVREIMRSRPYMSYENALILAKKELD